MVGRRLASAPSPRQAAAVDRGSGGLESEAGAQVPGGHGGPSGSPPVNRAFERRTMRMILVVEDETKIARLVGDYLEHAGFEVTVAGDGDTALASARRFKTDRIVGLELGADDYVVKPFSPKELVARVRAVLRRTEAARGGGPEVLRVADVEVDVPRMRVAVGGRPVELTPTEFQLLAVLVREPGRVFTRSQLLDAVHGVAIESYERAIDAHVKNIRK